MSTRKGFYYYDFPYQTNDLILGEAVLAEFSEKLLDLDMLTAEKIGETLEDLGHFLLVDAMI